MTSKHHTALDYGLNRLTSPRFISLLCISLSAWACESDEPSPPEGGTSPVTSGESSAGEGLAGEGLAGEELGGEGLAGEGSGGESSGGETPVTIDYSSIKLNEVTPRGEMFDWVEVVNIGDVEIDLSGCGLSDSLDEPMRYVIPMGAESIVPAGGFALFVISQDSTGFSLGGDELVTLTSPDGSLIDEVDYESDDAPVSTSFGRLPDGTGDWQTLYEPTPAGANRAGEAPVCGDMICDPIEDCPEDCVICGDGVCDSDETCAEDCSICGDQVCDEGEECELDCAEVQCGDGICSVGEMCFEDCEVAFGLIINEVVAAGDPDGIELVNIGETPLDLSEFYLTDDATLPLRAQLSGLMEPGEYLWLEVSDFTLGFKLGKDEEARLTHESGVLVDSVDWADGDAPVDQSYRRIPDLTGPFMTGPATPGAPNE